MKMQKKYNALIVYDKETEAEVLDELMAQIPASQLSDMMAKHELMAQSMFADVREKYGLENYTREVPIVKQRLGSDVGDLLVKQIRDLVKEPHTVWVPVGALYEMLNRYDEAVADLVKLRSSAKSKHKQNSNGGDAEMSNERYKQMYEDAASRNMELVVENDGLKARVAEVEAELREMRREELVRRRFAVKAEMANLTHGAEGVVATEAAG